MIHPTALVAPEARMGGGVSIGPYAIVEAGVEMGDNCVLHAHAVIKRGAVLGPGVAVHSFAVVGDTPQDLRFDSTLETGVRVGAGSVLREGVTINRSTKAGGFTVLGANCFIMGNAHIAHDCRVGDRAVLANGALVAGHVELGAGCFLGGGCGIHQFGRVGEGAFVSGLSAISLDVPPFVIVAERNRLSGLNLVGLRRRGCTPDTVAEMKLLFHAVMSAANIRDEAAALLAAGRAKSVEGRVFLEFFGTGKRGIVRLQRRRGGGHAAVCDGEERAEIS